MSPVADVMVNIQVTKGDKDSFKSLIEMIHDGLPQSMPAYPMGKMGNCPGPRAQGGPALAENQKRK